MKNGDTMITENGVYLYSKLLDAFLLKRKIINGVECELNRSVLLENIIGYVPVNENRDAEGDEIVLSSCYGLERLKFLRSEHPQLLIEMNQDLTLGQHLIYIEKEARNMEYVLTDQYMKAEGLTKELRGTDYWDYVGRLNNIINRVRATIRNDLIYAI